MEGSEIGYLLTCSCKQRFTSDTENVAWGSWRKHYRDEFEQETLHAVIRVERVTVGEDGMATARVLTGIQPRADQEWRDLVKWMAQTVHQAYHDDDGGRGWEGCVMSICTAAQGALGVGVGDNTGVG